MKTVAIVGVGLIGGSFALAIRKGGFDGRILGVSSPGTVEQALALGVIDSGATLEEACATADLIYLAGPINSIIGNLPNIGAMLDRDVLVTDAGSTKAAICEAGRAVKAPAMFVGGHPMAGKESRGVAAADADLFVGRPYVLTPEDPAMVDDQKLGNFLELARSTGAVPVILPPDVHDRTVAYTSHVPQLLSTALAITLSGVERANSVAGPSVRDLTRIAASPFEIWGDIFATNAGNIHAALQDFIVNLQYLQGNLTSDLSAAFNQARDSAARIRQNPK